MKTIERRRAAREARREVIGIIDSDLDAGGRALA